MQWVRTARGQYRHPVTSASTGPKRLRCQVTPVYVRPCSDGEVRDMPVCGRCTFAMAQEAGSVEGR